MTGRRNDSMKISEIPSQIKNYIGKIQNIHFPVQGHASFVASLTGPSGTFILKRTIHPLYSTCLKQWLLTLAATSCNNSMRGNKRDEYSYSNSKRIRLYVCRRIGGSAS